MNLEFQNEMFSKIRTILPYIIETEGIGILPYSNRISDMNLMKTYQLMNETSLTSFQLADLAAKIKM